MLKLSKYEFRKNKTILIAVAVGLLLLEAYFLFGIFSESVNHTATSAIFLMLYAFVCYFVVFILAISNYSKELNSKSSYLIFMTPNSALSIIFSKMFTILIIGTVMVLAIVGLGILDINLVFNTFPDAESFTDFVDIFMESFGIDSAELIISIIVSVIVYLINFFSIVTLAYFSITLSATVLQNKKFKGFVSVIIFLVCTYGIGFISDKLPALNDSPDTILQAMVSVLPTVLFEVVIMIVCIIGSAQLLDKKVSL
jgi:hypothetical protein